MRDIPKINYNTTLKKKVINENEATGTLNKNGFKTYKDFLENYDGNKNTKDDQESVSSVDSGISESKSYSTSTSSLNSEKGTAKINAFSNGRTGSFRKYMESYSDKKFSSVKPSIVNKQNVIKSEIVIQVNTPLRSEDVSDFSPPHPPPPPINVEVLSSAFVPPPPPLNLAPPPPPLNLAPLPPPMPHHVNIPVKKWAPVETENPCAPSTKEKVHNSAATNLAAVLTQNALFKRKAHESETKTETVTDFATSDSPKPIKQNSVNETEKHIVKPFVNHRTITVEVPLASPPKSLNDVDYDTTTIVPIADKSAKVNTSDPNVKKMVYSTYRGLLGAYNNKANGMIATLPRSMVREDRGITKQLESITLQGAIEKLNGRTNPKVEKD